MINFNTNIEQKRPAPVKQSSIVPIYSSLPPYAKDEKGKIINDTDTYKRVKVGEKNLQEIIDSNIEQCNYYRLIDAYNASGDINILNVCPNNNYGDVSNIPLDHVNNTNDYINSVEVKKVDSAKTEESVNTDEQVKTNDSEVKKDE